jgi:hypothetical protein
VTSRLGTGKSVTFFYSVADESVCGRLGGDNKLFFSGGWQDPVNIKERLVSFLLRYSKNCYTYSATALNVCTL